MDEQLIQVDVVESWWDYLLGVSTMILALINVWLIYIIYRWQHKDSNAIEERQRKVSQFNNIFLIPRMNILKNSFDGLIKTASKFESSINDESKKSDFFEELDSQIVSFDENFVSFIYGIDSNLYDEVHSIIEGMRDGLTSDVFDTNTCEINGAAYVQKLQIRINLNYKTLIKALFNYDGNIKKKDEKKTKPNVFLLIFLSVIIVLLSCLVYRNYTSMPPEEITIQLDSVQMNKMIDIVQKDSTSSK